MIHEKTIYVKLTNACNLKCKHCYNAQMNDACSMSDAVLAKVERYICSYALTNQHQIVDVQLHGGEPMLYDIDKINALLDAFPPNVKTSITTNLVYRLTNDKITLFKRMLPYDDVPFIMTSWDYGIRFTGKQESTWKNNVLKLHENGITVQPIICVTNKLVKKDPKEIFDMLAELSIANVNFERLTLTGNASDGKLKPTNREIDEWLFNAYLIAKENNVKVPLFEGIENSIDGFLVGCRARKCMQNVVTINPDGTIAACPNMADCWYAELNDIGQFNVRKSANKLRLDRKESHRELSCGICKLYQYCNGECCQLQHDETGCPGLKKIYEHLLANRKTTSV